MRRRLLHALVALYPPAFRRRYGRELHDLVDELSEREPRRAIRSAVGLAGGAAAEWWRRSRPQAMAALLVPAILTLAGIGLAAHAGSTTPARIASLERKVRQIQAVRGFSSGRGSACFIASSCGLNACPQFIAAAPGRPVKAPPGAALVTCTAATDSDPQPHTLFIDAAASPTS
jgi:hypothetical protein